MNHLRRPLVAALLAFLAGLLPALRYVPPAPPLLVAFAVLLAVCALSAVPGRGRRRAAPPHLLLAVFAACGLVVGALAARDARLDCRATLPDDLALRVTGVLTAAHRPPQSDARSPLVPFDAATVRERPGCGGEIRVRLPKDQPALDASSALTLHGRWRAYSTPVVRPVWPRDPRFHGYLLVDSLSASDAPGGAGFQPWLRLQAAADARLARLFPRHLSLVEALVLGRREHMDPDVNDRFVRSGLAHLLAISGMHVGLIAAALLLVATAARVPRRRAVLFTIAVTWAYLLVIGAPSSALRSAIMLSLALLALLVQRPSSSAAIVAAAAFAILAIRPLAILDPGFQLSFTGVIAIIYARPALLTLAPDALTREGMRRAITDSVVTGTAAFAVTAPFVAHHFGTIAPVSIPAGVPAIPLMSLALVGAMAALFLDLLFPALARALADGSALALDLLHGVAGLAASIPYGNGSVVTPPVAVWGAAALSALALGSAHARVRPHLRILLGTGATIAILLAWPLAAPKETNGVEVHFVDVGQGDAVAIRTPAGRWVLVDAGPAGDGFDAGARRVLPFLRAKGVRTLEAMVLTHPDLDHIGGAPAVLGGLRVRYVFEPGFPAGRSPYLAMLGAVEAHGTEWRAARAGRVMEVDGVRFDFLWPDSQTVDVPRDANQISAVLRVVYNSFVLILPGDVGSDVEHQLVRRHGGDLRAPILKLGHHGSATSSAAAFLDAVQPELAVVSAGRRNRYGHPSVPVLERLEARGIAVARTDRHGTVSVAVSPEGEWRWEAW